MTVRLKELQDEAIAYNNQHPLLQFPEEVTSHLFSYIKPSEVLQNIKLVCRSWSLIASDQILWKNLARKSFENPCQSQESIVLCKVNGEQRYIELLCESAAQGSKCAQKELLMTLKALEQTMDSCKLFKKLADDGNPWAGYCLATLYYCFGKKYQIEARELLEKATSKGVLEAQFFLGTLLYRLIGQDLYDLENKNKNTTEEIQKKGQLLILDLAEKEYAEAQIFAWRFFDLDEKIKKDFLEGARKAGDAVALYLLQAENEKPEELKQALSRAADSGHIRAAFELGQMSAEGTIPDNASLPFRLGHLFQKFKNDRSCKKEAWKQLKQYKYTVSYIKAYEEPATQYTLMLLSGLVLQKDENQAFHWYKKIVATREDLDEKFYEKEDLKKLIEANPAFCKRIVDFFSKKAEMGKAYYQFRLADLYEYGKFGVEKNLEKALELYEKAADESDLDATNRLCRIYGCGEYGKHDQAKFKKLTAQLFELSERTASDLLPYLRLSLNTKESLIEHILFNCLTFDRLTISAQQIETIQQLISETKIGSLRACFTLGKKLRGIEYGSYMNDSFSTEDVKEIEAFQEQEKDYELQLLFNLGRIFGSHKSKELKLLKHALRDESLLLFRLCIMHLSGKNIPINEEKALEYYEKLLRLDAKQNTHRAEELFSKCRPEFREKIFDLFDKKHTKAD